MVYLLIIRAYSSQLLKNDAISMGIIDKNGMPTPKYANQVFCHQSGNYTCYVVGRLLEKLTINEALQIYPKWVIDMCKNGPGMDGDPPVTLMLSNN